MAKLVGELAGYDIRLDLGDERQVKILLPAPLTVSQKTHVAEELRRLAVVVRAEDGGSGVVAASERQLDGFGVMGGANATVDIPFPLTVEQRGFVWSELRSLADVIGSFEGAPDELCEEKDE